MNLLKVKHKKLLLGVCFFINILILAFNAFLSVRFANTLINLWGASFSASSLNGSLMSVTFVMCIIMVGIDAKFGLIFSYISLVAGMLGALKTAFESAGHSSMPGVINSIVLIVSITIISEQMRTAVLDSQTDPITGVFNRRGLEKRLSESIRQKKKFRLVCIRLKNFRSICDDMGLEYADEITRTVSERIRKVVGPELMVGCIDASDFSIIVPEGLDAKDIAEKIVDELENKIVVHKEAGSLNCELRACAGIVSYPSDGRKVRELTMEADLALRFGVTKAQRRVVLYDRSLKERYERNSAIEKAVKDALNNDYFSLVYQPQFLADGKRLRGFETLLRLKLPNGTEYEPSEFIPVAEKSDLIMQIDEYVLKKALNEFSEIVRRDNNMFTLSVNISGKTVTNSGFNKILNKAVRDAEFPPECLEIEIREVIFASPDEQLDANLRALKRMGVGIALDDFGAGYSSLAQLMHLKVNLLKIDKSIIDEIGTGRSSREFLDSLVSFGHVMGSNVVSQGVENEEQLDELKGHKVDMIQGFVWGHPMSYEAATELIGKDR